MFGADSYVYMLGKRPCMPRKKKKKDNIKYYGVNAGFFLLYVELVSCFYLFAPNTKKQKMKCFLLAG